MAWLLIIIFKQVGTASTGITESPVREITSKRLIDTCIHLAPYLIICIDGNCGFGVQIWRVGNLGLALVIGLSMSTSTFTGTCGLICGKTCTNRSPVCRYLALKLPTSTGDDFGIVDLFISTRMQLGTHLGARLSRSLKFAARHPAPCRSTGSSPRLSCQPRTPL